MESGEPRASTTMIHAPGQSRYTNTTQTVVGTMKTGYEGEFGTTWIETEYGGENPCR